MFFGKSPSKVKSENFTFKNLWKKDKGWSLQKTFQFYRLGILKRAWKLEKFETPGRFIEKQKNAYTVNNFGV